MNARGGGGKSAGSTVGNNKGKEVSKVEQLSNDVAGINLSPARDDGDWEVISRKTKNKSGGAAKPWGSQNSNAKAWGQPDTVQKLGMRSNDGSGRTSGWTAQTGDSKRPSGRGTAWSQPSNTSLAPQPVIRPPLEHGWNWQGRPGHTNSRSSDCSQEKNDGVVNNEDNGDEEDEDEDDGDMEDTDDDLLSEDFDSDSSQKSHESRKKNRWLKRFFESLDKLSVEEINEPERQWHCPACQGGPGAIDWYRGLQPLMTHAKTKGSKRVRLHRELAELLEEELRRKGTSVVPAGEVYGKWKGLTKEEKDREIVWPPMVIIMNTRLEKDENEKWIGMGNQELLDYFSEYAAAKGRHSYGPQGHRGMSVLIFEGSARGFVEAERLHQHFIDEGTDRNAWDRHRVLFRPGGQRQLYGYIALKEDMDMFNQHSQGKSKLKFEMRSYNDAFINQINQMSADNEQLVYYRNTVIKKDRHAKALEKSIGIVSEKLRQTMEENRIVRQRTQIYQEQQKEELDFQEQFFKDQIQLIHDERDAKEENFEKLQQKEREKLKQLNANSSSKDEYRRRAEELEKFIQFQEKEMEEYVAVRDRLIKEHEDKTTAMKRRHWEELVGLEQEFDAELNSLMKKYVPHREGNANL